MKKSLIKGFILGTIFVFSIILFSNMMNKDITENTADMEQATLPVMYMRVADLLVNPMYGYKEQMQEKYLRESLTPLSTTRDLTAVVKPCGNTIESVTYEVLTADGSEVVESAKVSSLKTDGDYLKADFHLDTPILMNQEYTLRFTVDYGDRAPAFYYTRLIQRAGLNTSQYLEFVQGFYEKCVNKEAATDLTTYIEPDENATNSSFTEVNVHSSFDQLTWGSLSPTIIRKGIPVIKEINETTCSIALDYDISADDPEKNKEIYNVNEFYRMRYSKSRVMLLDFERNAQQIFDGELDVLTSQGINLGVVNKDISYVSNQNADIIAFVQEGALWSYNRSANKAARIFSFREKDQVDERTDFLNHDIKIVRVEESGDVDFVVYGYMSRGLHEGMMGISVYHYSAERNVAEEQIFIPSTLGFSFLEDDVKLMSYVNKEDKLYLFMENTLYCVDLQEKIYDRVLENVNRDCFVVSKSQSVAAWMNEMEENGSETITVRNLETGNQQIIQADSGQKLKALGFINNDFIYGTARDEDIVTDAAGNTTFAMYTVKILNAAGNVIKEYQEDGRWVSGVKLEEGLLELLRVESQESAYVPAASEHIMNNLQTSEETVSIHLSVSERKGTQVALDFSKTAKSKSMLMMKAKYLVPDEANEMGIDSSSQEDQLYYVYAYGKLDSIYTKVNEAVKRAEERLGVVLNSEQRYIWERGNQKDKELLNVEEIPEAVLAGTLDEQALRNAMGESAAVINLTGCSLESVLYQVNMGRAVAALTPTGESVVIVGYDTYNTILYNPDTQETYYSGRNDSTVLFEAAGNVFLSYIKGI